MNENCELSEDDPKYDSDPNCQSEDQTDYDETDEADGETCEYTEEDLDFYIDPSC